MRYAQAEQARRAAAAAAAQRPLPPSAVPRVAPPTAAPRPVPPTAGPSNPRPAPPGPTAPGAYRPPPPGAPAANRPAPPPAAARAAGTRLRPTPNAKPFVASALGMVVTAVILVGHLWTLATLGPDLERFYTTAPASTSSRASGPTTTRGRPPAS